MLIPMNVKTHINAQSKTSYMKRVLCTEESCRGFAIVGLDNGKKICKEHYRIGNNEGGFPVTFFGRVK